MTTENTSYYKLYLVDECPFCKAAADLISSGPCEYLITYYDWEDKTLNEVKNSYQHKTVPIIVKVNVDGDNESEEFIGGYTELVRHFEKEGTNG